MGGRVEVTLSFYAAVALRGLPQTFVGNGVKLGCLEICDGVPLLSNALTASCLSFVLRRTTPRTGLYLRL